MSETVPGVGQLSDVPRPVAEPRFEGLQLSPEDWFVLSRVDGQTNVRELFALSPTGRAETIAILKRLAENALIELPGAGAAGSAGSNTAIAREPELPPPPRNWPTRYEDFTVDPALLAEDVPLSAELRKRVLYFHAHQEQVNYYELLGVERGASAPAIKRAYFTLSKVFHPDRFFRQELGSFGARLDQVFRWLNEAYKTLSNRQRRAAYDTQLTRGVVSGSTAAVSATRVPSVSTQAFEERPRSGVSAPATGASELTRRPLTELLGEGKRLERAEDFRGAVEHYEAALAQRESAEVMNRIAECLIRLRSDLDHAERRARGAVALSPQTARYHVALAFILEQLGREAEAIASYREALSLDPTHQGARTRLDRLQGAR